MPFNAQNGTVRLGGTGMDYIRFGSGERQLVILPDAQLRMYDRLGHGLYEEAGDFNRTVLDFLRGNESEPCS